jgi:hypothetical protein
MAFEIQSPFELFVDTDGTPLENGYVYIGEPSQNPETNPISVYWDANATILAAQPIRTLAGFPMRNNSPSKLFAQQDFSMTVRDKNGVFLYSEPSSLGGETIEALQDEWVNAQAATYVSGTSFTVPGDQTSGRFSFHPGRRVKAVGSATGTIYGTVSTAVYGVLTTATVIWDSGSLSNEALVLYVGILSADNFAMPSVWGAIAGEPVVTNYYYEWWDVRRYGILDDGTDQTSALVALFGTVSASAEQLFKIPFGVYFDTKTVMESLPVGVVLFDLSGINSFSDTSETTKEFGLTSFDKAASDTHWVVTSGHHAVINLNNYGNAEDSPGSPTASALARRASLAWSAGKYEKGPADKQGYRLGAIQQFSKSSAGNFWQWAIRSLAPWDAITAEYERWYTATVYAAGAYCTSNGNMYSTAAGGTSGATAPSHTTGTVSDGGINWTYVDSADRSLHIVDQYGRTLIGIGNFLYTFEHRVSPVDPGGGGYSMRLGARGISKNADFILAPTDGAEALTAQPFLRAQNGVGLRVMNAAGSSGLALWDASGFQASGLRGQHKVITDTADTTPSVLNVDAVYLSYTGATNLTALDDGTDNQLVTLIATNANATLVSSATLLLTGSINLTMAAWDAVMFRKVPTSISNRWIEIGRSEK